MFLTTIAFLQPPGNQSLNHTSPCQLALPAKLCSKSQMSRTSFLVYPMYCSNIRSSPQMWEVMAQSKYQLTFDGVSLPVVVVKVVLNRCCCCLRDFSCPCCLRALHRCGAWTLLCNLPHLMASVAFLSIVRNPSMMLLPSRTTTNAHCMTITGLPGLPTLSPFIAFYRHLWKHGCHQEIVLPL